jgi:hypothetical protein
MITTSGSIHLEKKLFSVVLFNVYFVTCRREAGSHATREQKSVCSGQSAMDVLLLSSAVRLFTVETAVFLVPRRQMTLVVDHYNVHVLPC